MCNFKKITQLLILLFFNYFVLFSQNIENKYLRKEIYLDSLNNFIDLYGNNKTIPENFKTETIVALSFYPELKETKIIFTDKKIRTTMQAVPGINFIFKSKKSRIYYIYFNNNKGKHKSIDFGKFSFNSMVGIIGHELGHISYYSHKNSISIIENGFLYIICPKFKKKYENNTDKIAIEHNLGYSLYENRLFLLTNPNIKEKSKIRTKKYYLSPEEIIEFINIKAKK